MKLIFLIFIRDLRRLAKSPMGLIVMVGVIALPSLYAWFNIAANWDPYANTAGIQVAVANEDAGCSLEGATLNVGETILTNLKANDQIGWQFVDKETALQGVRDGSYYAAIIIPTQFSAKLSSILSTNLQRPTIAYYVNEKKNAIAPKITDKGVSAVQQQINAAFIQVATEAIVTGMGVTADQLTGNGSALLSRFSDILHNADQSLAQVQQAIGIFGATADAVDQLTASTQLLLPDAKTLFQNTATTLDSTQSLLSAMQHTANQTVDFIGAALDQAISLGDANQLVVDQLFEAASQGTKLLPDSLAKPLALHRQAIRQNEALLTTLTTLNNKLPHSLAGIDALTGSLKKANQHLAKGVTALEDAQDTLTATGTLTADTQKELNALRQAAATDLATARRTFTNTTRPALSQTLTETAGTLTSFTQVLTPMATLLPNVDSLLTHMNQTVLATKDTLTHTDAMIGTVRQEIQKISNELTGVGTDQPFQTLLNLLRNDSALMGEFMAAPVEIQTTSLYAIRNYGSAMAPFYSTLALWVGGIVMVAILKTKVDEDDRLKKIKPYQAYLGRYLLFLWIGLAQATLICLGDLYFLGIQCTNQPLFFLSAWVASLVYTMIIYTLTVSFGDVGKALAVILLVIQIAGAGGTFPIEVTPAFFQNISPFLPFTYGINAMRETVAGIYGTAYWLDLGHLLLFLPAALIVGLLLRKPLIRLNAFFESRLADTHLL